MTRVLPLFFALMLLVFTVSAPCPAQDAGTATGTRTLPEDLPDPEELVARAWDYWRGSSSESVLEMTIHRPDWERTVTLKAWTKGRENSIFKTLAPAKDRGNGTLKRGREMWTYNPKVNRIIKIPPSMMSQSWMGSDFSNNDLSKADSILLDYTHEITGVEEHDGQPLYLVRSVPKPQAPVVWGLQTMKVRADGVLLEEVFYDEALEPVKIMTGQDIRMADGRPMPMVWTMRKTGEEYEGEYTRLLYKSIDFDLDLPDSLFTTNALKAPVR